MSSIPVNNPLKQADLQIEVLFDAGIISPASDAKLRQSATIAATSRGFSHGEIGIRVTSDAEIRRINRQHLKHDYATDVISFSYHCEPPCIEGEIVVSAEMARQQATEVARKQSGWNAEYELLLYAVHGVLHLTGMDDQDSARRQRMRDAEQIVMRQLGIDQIDRFGADAIASSAVEHGR